MPNTILVRYTGPDSAILAGYYIYHGETRRVTPAQLAVARLDRPDGFEVLGDEPADGDRLTTLTPQRLDEQSGDQSEDVHDHNPRQPDSTTPAGGAAAERPARRQRV